MASTLSPFRPDLLRGQVALITGGSSGIGLEIARQLGLHGAKIAISGRRRNVLDEACEDLKRHGIDAVGIQGDVRSYPDCERMVAGTVTAYHHLSILINCAAGNFLSAAEQLSSNGFKTVMEIDTLGTFNASRAAIATLRHHQSSTTLSSIVNISATLHYGATWYQSHASAAKAAVDSLTRSLALEWGAYGVRVNGVAPGPIEGTAGLTKLAPGASDALQSIWKERIPIGRLGTKHDIAMAVVFLCSSEAAGYVTGHTMVVDGGEWMWRPQVVPRDQVLAASKAVESKSRRVGTPLSKL